MASTRPVDSPPPGADETSLDLTLSVDGQVLPLQYVVVPLTAGLTANQTDGSQGLVNIDAVIVAINATNLDSITNSTVAFLSCDFPPAGSTDPPPDSLLTGLVTAQPRPYAVLLYSTKRNYCDLRRDDGIDYDAILSMTDAGDSISALDILSDLPSVDTPGRVRVAITGGGSDSHNSSDGSRDDGSAGNAPGSHSAVAMSILYGITGLVTVLFLVIISTGAIRAHRHPERYGPRSASYGRPAQSRARGLARALLDTLPIVKFNGDEKTEVDAKLDALRRGDDDGPAGRTPSPAGDPERGEGGNRGVTKIPVKSAAGPGITVPTPTAAEAADIHADRDANATEKGADDTAVNTETVAAVAAADTASPDGDGGGEHLGCSICTDDFAIGEDVRVLPCSHKFHPECVDPWLINVSGTCPLCRYDLRSNADDATTTGNDLPPPIDIEGVPRDGQDALNRGSATALGPGPVFSAGHHHLQPHYLFRIRSLNYASQVERIEGLRNISAVERQGRRARFTTRLRDTFRMRTRQPPEPDTPRIGASNRDMTS